MVLVLLIPLAWLGLALLAIPAAVALFRASSVADRAGEPRRPRRARRVSASGLS